MNFSFNDYLTKCDLIYKYNLESINLIPKIKKIDIALKIDESFNEGFTSPEMSENLMKLNLFLILYVSYFCFPFIKYLNFKNSDQNAFSLNSIVSQKSSIFALLDSLFIDNSYKLKRLGLLSLKNLKKESLIQGEQILFKVKLPLSVFDDLNEVPLFKNVNKKKFSITLNFSIENLIFSKLKNSKSFLRNLPYFWVFH